MFEEVRRKYIIATARLKSCEAAARELYTDSSTITRAIKKEEKELGYLLFERVGHSMRITTEGKEYLSAAQEMDRVVRDYLIGYDNAQNMLKGEVRIGSSRSKAVTIVAPPAIEFLKKHPQITMSAPTGEDDKLLQLLEDDMVDAVLVQDISIPKSLYGTLEIMSDKPHIAIPPEWEPLPTKGMGKKYPLADFSCLEGRDFVGMSVTHPLHFALRELVHLTKKKPRIRYVADNVINATFLCGEGIGATLTVDSVINSPLSTMRFMKEQIAEEGKAPQIYEIANKMGVRHLMLVYNDKATLSLATREFINEWLLPSLGVEERIGLPGVTSA